MWLRTVHDALLQAADVVAGDALREGEDGGHMLGYANLIDGQVGIRRDDRAPREVHALAGQVPSEAPLFALQPLHEPPALPKTGQHQRLP